MFKLNWENNGQRSKGLPLRRGNALIFDRRLRSEGVFIRVFNSGVDC